MCRERSDHPDSGSPYCGSSPRVQGTRLSTPCPGVASRFIPACAGNAAALGKDRHQLTVHPRVCRERFGPLFRTNPIVGSSPRVQGTLTACCSNPDRQRFIPACAGNASMPSVDPAKMAVHPRVCRERRLRMMIFLFTVGSSPRVQGTRTRRGFSPPRIRFIPACAGNAWHITRILTGSSVHPRVCRERTPPPYLSTGQAGSSPRVQGTHHFVVFAPIGYRFIPACAGNA